MRRGISHLSVALAGLVAGYLLAAGWPSPPPASRHSRDSEFDYASIRRAPLASRKLTAKLLRDLALGVDHPGAVRLLADMYLHDPDAPVRAISFSALAESRNPFAMNLSDKAFSDEDPMKRANAAYWRCRSQPQDEHVEAAVRDLTSHPDEEVRECIMNILRQRSEWGRLRLFAERDPSPVLRELAEALIPFEKLEESPLQMDPIHRR